MLLFQKLDFGDNFVIIVISLCSHPLPTKHLSDWPVCKLVPTNCWLKIYWNVFFITLQEFPRVHYRVAKTIDASTMTTLRDLVPTKLAASVWNCLAKYKTTIPEFPQTETCELLIVDRSIDQVCVEHICGLTFILLLHWVYGIHLFIPLCFFGTSDCANYSWMDLWCYVPWSALCGWQ